MLIEGIISLASEREVFGWQCVLHAMHSDLELTCGRLYLRKGKTEEDLTEALASLPASLAHSRNLHAADVYPVEWPRPACLPTLISLLYNLSSCRPLSPHVTQLWLCCLVVFPLALAALNTCGPLLECDKPGCSSHTNA